MKKEDEVSTLLNEKDLMVRVGYVLETARWFLCKTWTMKVGGRAGQV